MNETLVKIKELFAKKKKKMTFKEIQKMLELRSDEIDLLEDILLSLELEGYLYLNDYNEYMLFPQNSNMAIGEIKLDNKKRPFALVKGRVTYIPNNYLNGALTGDYVLVNRNPSPKTSDIGMTVKKIIKRQSGAIIFECKLVNDKLILEPYNWPFKIPVELSKKDQSRLIEGDRLLINVSTLKNNGKYEAEIINTVGHKDDPLLDVKTIAASHGVRTEFPEEVIKEAEALPTYVSEEEIAERVKSGGRDYRTKMIFSIDGKTAKDLDDAISVDKLPNGNYLLGVHIANVSYYVKEGSELQKEAFKRGTSYYFLNYVIPMLPHILSNGICSLNEGVDRMARTFEMEIDKNGNIVKYDIFNSIINSKKKMSYEDVNKIFVEGKTPQGYKPFYNKLIEMRELSDILSTKKNERGYIDFGDTDVKIGVDEFGKPQSIKLASRGPAEKLIENYMLSANEIVGMYAEDTFIHYIGLPYVYRVHEMPKQESIEEAIRYLRMAKYSIKKANYQNSRALQELLNNLSKFEEFPAIAEILLRGLSRAKYSTRNQGHFGLALSNYTQSTSPIRRYPDLQTHYILDKYTPENILNLNIDEESSKVTEVCTHTSSTEKQADFVERDINLYKMAEFMESYIGEEFEGMITYINKKSMSVRTTDQITGSIPFSSLMKLGYELDSNFIELVNKKDGNRLKLGDKVTIEVKVADKENRKIIFDLKEAKQKRKTKKGVS